MKQENNSAAQNILHEQEKMAVAITPGTILIARLVPYLECRELAAKKYFDYTTDMRVDQVFKDELLKMVDHCNDEIIKILGL